MSEAAFTLTYDGPAFADGTMDVADLAPALVGLSQYMKAVSRVVNGERFEVSVRAKALETGCFQIHLFLDGNFVDQMIDMLSGKTATAIANTLAISGAAVALVLQIGGRLVKRVRPAAPGSVAIELADGTVIEAPETVARVATDSAARAGLEKSVADPLDQEGVETVRFGIPSAPITVAKPDVEAFRGTVAAGDQILETQSRMVFSIASLSFQPGNKWRLSTGKGAPISVTVADAEFIGRVQRSEESFAKGDFLICDVRTNARQSGDRLVTDYIIEKVVEHRRIQPPQTLI